MIKLAKRFAEEFDLTEGERNELEELIVYFETHGDIEEKSPSERVLSAFKALQKCLVN